MRPFAIAFIAALAACGQAFANTPLTDGLVKKLDKPKGNVVIAHGPLPNGMPAMAMAFRAKDPAWIDQLKEGQKIRFATEEVNGIMILQRYETVK
jgi:Cu/Ag efflux protein CusF